MRVGTQQIGRIAIQMVCVRRRSIRQRANDDQAQRARPGAFPAHGLQGFDLKGVALPGGIGFDLLPRNPIPKEEQ